jgi:hypothetical protein
MKFGIQEHWLGLVNRWSMMRILARRTKAGRIGRAVAHVAMRGAARGQNFPVSRAAQSDRY